MAVAKQTRNQKPGTRNRKLRASVKTTDFPQINRKIPAVSLIGATLSKWFSWRLIVVSIIVSLLLLQLTVFGQNLYTRYQEAQVKKAEKLAIEQEITKWENVVRQRPNYRDAYFELAVLTYELGRLSETKYYLGKVFELDPNFEPARELEQTLAR